MAVKSVIKKETLTLKLDNGATATGGVKTVSVSMGSINKDTMDISKAHAIALLLAPCLSKSLYSLEHTVTNNIVED